MAVSGFDVGSFVNDLNNLARSLQAKVKVKEVNTVFFVVQQGNHECEVDVNQYERSVHIMLLNYVVSRFLRVAMEDTPENAKAQLDDLCATVAAVAAVAAVAGTASNRTRRRREVQGQWPPLQAS